MALRMLHYVTFLYQYLKSQTESGQKLPAVFPLLLYNGEQSWQSVVQVSRLIESTIPAKEYWHCDVESPAEELIGV